MLSRPAVVMARVAALMLVLGRSARAVASAVLTTLAVVPLVGSASRLAGAGLLSLMALAGAMSVCVCLSERNVSFALL